MAMHKLNQDTILKHATEYDLRDVRTRFCIEHDIDDEFAAEIELELKRFLVLSALNPDCSYPMTSVVDPFWHEFIVFTRLYGDFCSSVAGKFIHHEPRLKDDEPLEDTAARFQRFFDDYRSVFGHDAPRHLWPRLEDLGKANGKENCSTCHHHDCSRCNTCD